MERKSYLEDKDIIVVGITPFDWDLPNNCRDIAYELAKKNRVLYVNIPLKRSEVLRKSQVARQRQSLLHGKKGGLIQISQSLWTYFPDAVTEPINRIRLRWVFDSLNYINNKRYATSILKCVRQLGFKDFVLFNDNDVYTGFFLKELLQPRLSIYYTRDMLASMPYWQTQLPRLEPLLMKKSDLVVANSLHLTQHAKRHNAHSYYIGQGCDVSHFIQDPADLEIPPDIESIAKPRIGYIGALTSQRLDISLIGELAERRQDWSIILIGPSDQAFRDSFLQKLANVHFLGTRDFSALPNYLKAIDVCINPQLVNDLTIGNYPRKVDEYLAAGKPVVATATDAMVPFADYTYLATDCNSYEKSILEALRANSPKLMAERKEFAASHTWKKCVDELDKSIIKCQMANEGK